MTDSFPKSQKGWHVVNPTTLGDRFAATLKEWLTPKEFAEMKRRNETDPTYANLSCASHSDQCCVLDLEALCQPRTRSAVRCGSRRPGMDRARHLGMRDPRSDEVAAKACP
jgi:hypothetical protein